MEMQKNKNLSHLKFFKKSKNIKVLESFQLPTVLNINPRSLYNKKKEFITLVDEEEIDVGCISETWERKDYL